MSGSSTASLRIARWYVPRGRLGLSRFWTRYCLPFLGVASAAYLLDGQLAWYFAPGTLASVVSWFGGPFSALFAAATLMPSVAAVVCRLHDRGHSADWLWWLALPGPGWVILIDAVWFSAGRPADNVYGPSPDRAPTTPGTRREWVA